MLWKVRTLHMMSAAQPSQKEYKGYRLRVTREANVVSLHRPMTQSGFISRSASTRAADPTLSVESDRTWQLIRDDLFDRIRSDQEMLALIHELARSSDTPHADLLARMIGLDALEEDEAQSFFLRLLDHRRRLSAALGRLVDVRVAALDLLTSKPAQGGEHATRPILVTPSLIARALEEAGSDAVTGLPQRNLFMSLLRHELRQRRRRNVVVAFLDVDGMKRVNDTSGHARGDELLRSLARSGRAALRHGDIFARIGGDEFALMLVDVTPEEAMAAVDRLRAEFEENSGATGASFSAGLVLASPSESADEVLARADAAMYRDKRERSRMIARGR